MIPANQLNPQAANALMQYLRTEITQAKNDRGPLEEQWIRYQTQYRAEPEEKVKKFPFEGAANLVVPVIATDVDTIFSRLMGILFAPNNLWSCKPLNDMMVDYAPKLEEFLEWAQHNELGVYDACADWLLELTKLGTGILKQRYTRESKRVYQFRETLQGIMEQQQTMMVKDHPTIEHVSLFDFYIPASATSISSAPWVAERIALTWGQLQNRVRAGVYQNLNNIQQHWANERGSKMEQVMQNLDRFSPGLGDKFDVYECWLDYDIQGIGEPQAIVATIHLPSQSFLRIDYNPFFNQEKPYSSARYLRQEKRFYGIGLCEMLDQFQDEISTMHNQRLDNATLANSSMFKGRKGVVKQDEPIFPGRWFLLDNLDDVQPMNMGQRYDSTVPYEQLTQSYASKRTGVNDYVSATDSVSANSATATTAVQQLREGSKRFDQVLREARQCLGEVGTRTVELYQQFNQHGKEYLALGAKDGEYVRRILEFPMELIRNSIGVELTASSAALNKEVEVRTNTIVMQMLMQFYQQLMTGMSYMLNPQIPPPMQQMAQQMVMGGSTLMRRILTGYGMQDVDKLVPELGDALTDTQRQLDSILQLVSGQQGQTGGLVPAGGMGSGGYGPPGALQGFGAQPGGSGQLPGGMSPAGAYSGNLPAFGSAGYAVSPTAAPGQ